MKKNKIVLALSVFSFTILLVHSSVHAASFGLSGPSGESIIVTASLNKSTYTPGEQIFATGLSIKSTSPIIGQVSLDGGANGGSASLLFKNISNGQTVTNNNSVSIGNAQNSAGTYNADFTAALYTNPITVTASAGEDGHGGAGDTLCLIRATISDGIPVSDEIYGVIQVLGKGYPYGYSYNPYNVYSDGSINGSLGVVGFSIPAGQTQSPLITSQEGVYYPGIQNSANGTFFCSPAETYDTHVFGITPSDSNGRPIIGS